MVEYIEETHTYLVDGVIVPSVTQLLKYKFPDKYKGVPAYILSDKANYGTKVHKLIEIINKTEDFEPVINAVDELDYIIASTLKQYIKIKKELKMEVLNQEVIVYNDQIAGRYDILASIKYNTDVQALIDIKTTAQLDEEYLSWQLSIYKYLGEFDEETILAVIWLPKKELGKYKEIKEKSKKEIENLIKEWRKIYG